MIDANQARKLSEEGRKVDLTRIYKKIEEAARKGDCMLHLDITADIQKGVNYIMSELVLKGFTVKRNNGSDFRDSSSWDYLVISW